MLAFARLLRLSLAPSAAADVIVGVLLGYGGLWPGGPAPWLLVAASLLIYHGAMALNDWADRVADAQTRPGRPLPSGAISPRLAWAMGWGLPALGVALAAQVSAQLALGYGLLAACAVFYDLRGRGPFLGPLLLAACRAANLFLGMSLAWAVPGSQAPAPTVALVLPALIYGGFIACVSLLGRLEDGQGGAIGRRPTLYLRGAAAMLVLIPALGWAQFPTPSAWAWAASVGLAWSAAGWLLRATPKGGWTRPLIGRAMGRALRTTLPFMAALAVLHAGHSESARWIAAGALAAVPISHALRRVLPPT